MIREFLQSVNHPWEISAMVKMKLSGLGRTDINESLDAIAENINDLDFCYAVLNKVSRSFAAVIQQLPDQLRDSVCVFYLVLRGLDSIEDDMSLPKEEKLPLLQSFHTKSHDNGWKITGVGDSTDYQCLLANYDKVSRAFQQLDQKYRSIILDICQRMGNGMAEFSERPIRSISDYDQYCHYVAGLVGIGLSRLFAVSGLESSLLTDQLSLSNSMGLFLQKTNIIRDYHEDLHLERTFWPGEVWSQYARDLNYFELAPYDKSSVACLNHLVADALQHTPDCLSYLAQLQNQQVFRFCAIPQVMAIATLAKLYNNPKVFTGVVKIRKGLTAQILMDINDFTILRKYFNYYANDLFGRLDENDPHYELMLDRVVETIKAASPRSERVYYSKAV